MYYRAFAMGVAIVVNNFEGTSDPIAAFRKIPMKPLPLQTLPAPLCNKPLTPGLAIDPTNIRMISWDLHDWTRLDHGPG